MMSRTHDPKLSEAGFVALLLEIQRRCVEPEPENITPLGRKAVRSICNATKAYLDDLGFHG